MKSRRSPFQKHFSEIWEKLFTSPVHLDSALSRAPSDLKPRLASVLPLLLRQPVSISRALGIRLRAQEPWILSKEDLTRWEPALLMARELENNALPGVSALAEDFPPSLLEAWSKAFGLSVTEELIRSLALPPLLSLRVRRHLDRTELARSLAARVSDLSPLGLVFDRYTPVLGTPEWKQGAFEIQDEGSQLMALFALWPEAYSSILQDHPGRAAAGASPAPSKAELKTVIDACAGAGGKTLALADLLKGRARVYAYDTSEKKLQALRKRATRAKLTNIQTLALTEGREKEKIAPFFGKADLVLIDAPCSGWGVLKRNPDLKWRQTGEELERLPALQQRLLTLYGQLVRPGGRLVYGTCTFRPEETTKLIPSVLAHGEFQLQAQGFLGPGPCDGFFMASLLKP